MQNEHRAALLIRLLPSRSVQGTAGRRVGFVWSVQAVAACGRAREGTRRTGDSGLHISAKHFYF